MRLPRKLKKRLKSERFIKKRTLEALRLVSMACGSAAAAMNAYMIAISSYKAVNYLQEFNLPNHEYELR